MHVTKSIFYSKTLSRADSKVLQIETCGIRTNMRVDINVNYDRFYKKINCFHSLFLVPVFELYCAITLHVHIAT